MRKLDYTSRFVGVTPTLSPNQSSHNSIGHGGQYYMVVTASTSQQVRMKERDLLAQATLCLFAKESVSVTGKSFSNPGICICNGM